MIYVPIRVCGDHWLNANDVQKQLMSIPRDQEIILDVWSEGPSLTALGVVDAVLQLGFDYTKVSVTRWANEKDPVPFHRRESHRRSHFFGLSRTYVRDMPGHTHEYRYGMFCGRRSWARCGMLYDAYHVLGDRCLFSAMGVNVPLPWQISQVGIDLDRNQGWIDPAGMQWWKNLPISSIDDHNVRDQYSDDHNTNLDLLDHYHRFDIEIVMETFCRGPAFLPTEKTVRPIMGGRAMLVYGPRGFLSNLRDAGFRTWGECWDESYDDLEGPERWKTMLQLAQQNLEPDPLVSQHNRQVLEDMI